MENKACVAALCIVPPLLLLPGLLQANTVVVENKSGQTVTLTDFISFANANNTGASKVHMKKKDATDDINIAAGGKKNFDVGDHKSWTVSWNNSRGQEVETDTTNFSIPIAAQQLAMFDADFNGLYDLEYDFAAIGLVPNPTDSFLIDALGHPVDTLGNVLDWITFFDVTQSITGFIERDAFGNPTSPFLPEDTAVTASFQWAITALPEPPVWGLMGVGLGILARLMSKQSVKQTPRASVV